MHTTLERRGTALLQPERSIEAKRHRALSDPELRLTPLMRLRLIIGIVVGAGNFQDTLDCLRANVQANLVNYACGALEYRFSDRLALCMRNCARPFPSRGGNIFLNAFGRGFSFCMPGPRITVIQTVSFAMMAYIAGDYNGTTLSDRPIFRSNLRDSCCGDTSLGQCSASHLGTALQNFLLHCSLPELQS